MPANVGEMFYYGEVPWHRRGNRLNEPADMKTAIQAGGLDWEVETVPIMTDENPPSLAPMRLAVVRSDRKPGTHGRVLGIAHREFRPLQNRQGLAAFDAVFGRGKKVYHTGGYLGNGEVVWVLARLPGDMEVVRGDRVNTYVLYSNSHNGSLAIDFRLTTVRVVCRNTLSLALKRDTRTVFKHAHQGDYSGLKDQVEDFFNDTLQAADALKAIFQGMIGRRFDDEEIKTYVEGLFPIPVERPADRKDSRTLHLYRQRVQKMESIRETVYRLGANGLGADIKGVRGSLWGALNAVLEYADHHAKVRTDPFVYSLFGAGAALKRKAYDMAVGYMT